MGRSLLQPQTTGESELVGLIGRVETPIAPDGKIFVRGEIWNASAEEDLAVGESVEVVSVQGLKVRVRRTGRA